MTESTDPHRERLNAAFNELLTGVKDCLEHLNELSFFGTEERLTYLVGIAESTRDAILAVVPPEPEIAVHGAMLCETCAHAQPWHKEGPCGYWVGSSNDPKRCTCKGFSYHERQFTAAPEPPSAPAPASVYDEIKVERDRAEAKFPDQHLPNGTTFRYWQAMSIEAKESTDRKHANGTLTWLDIVKEEVFEAFAETDPAKLRAELVQVGAMAVRWIEDLDRAGTPEGQQ